MMILFPQFVCNYVVLFRDGEHYFTKHLEKKKKIQILGELFKPYHKFGNVKPNLFSDKNKS